MQVARQPAVQGRLAVQAAATLTVSAQPVLEATLQLSSGDPTNFPTSMPLSLSCSVLGTSPTRHLLGSNLILHACVEACVVCPHACRMLQTGREERAEHWQLRMTCQAEAWDYGLFTCSCGSSEPTPAEVSQIRGQKQRLSACMTTPGLQTSSDPRRPDHSCSAGGGNGSLVVALHRSNAGSLRLQLWVQPEKGF